jgi:hypothetical protein
VRDVLVLLPLHSVVGGQQLTGYLGAQRMTVAPKELVAGDILVWPALDMAMRVYDDFVRIDSVEFVPEASRRYLVQGTMLTEELGEWNPPIPFECYLRPSQEVMVLREQQKEDEQ